MVHRGRSADKMPTICSMGFVSSFADARQLYRGGGMLFLCIPQVVLLLWWCEIESQVLSEEWSSLVRRQDGPLGSQSGSAGAEVVEVCGSDEAWGLRFLGHAVWWSLGDVWIR
jgi:hypothetical protein